MEPLCVETTYFAAVCDKPKAISFHQWCAADSLEWPIMHTAGDQLFAAVLPQKFASLFIERQ
jgi:hypothetical protein